MSGHQHPLRTPMHIPSTDNSEKWQEYLRSQQWRTEPEIDQDRQKQLDEWRNTESDIHKGKYPFGGRKLCRADIERLLVTHRNGRGPVDWSDPSERNALATEKTQGLDLRGADLRGVDLGGLPLTGMIGGLDWHNWRDATVEEREKAAIHLEETYMRETHLEGAKLRSAYLKDAYLRHAHLDGTYLRYAHFEGASLRYASLVRANMGGVFFDHASQLDHVVLSNNQGECALVGGVHWNEVDLSGIDWSQVTILGDEHKAYEQYRRSDGTRKDKAKQYKDLRSAVRAYRQLAAVLQSQGLNEEAARFAYRGQQIQRRLLRREKNIPAWLFSHTLDLFAGYGYKPFRFFLAAIYPCVFFGLVYYALSFWKGPRMTFPAALIMSLQNLLTPDFKSLGASLQRNARFTRRSHRPIHRSNPDCSCDESYFE
jgi:uncharacterized protein YjbI with pentapeptide repeats